MKIDGILKRYGLFDAKVPRYTSYPPANRFKPDVGRKKQKSWLSAVRADEAISLYIHVPFCRRLCWFCACRTQGTKTLRPVEDYVQTLLKEIAAIRSALPEGVRLSRLHLGGGTPTILSGPLMDRLLSTVFDHFGRSEDFEFSAEIDPTDAGDEVLGVLSAKGMNRASIGVQDFAPSIQAAIGRAQGFDLTRDLVAKLRDGGIDSLNIDLLYGLPMQTWETLSRTVDQVISLEPDRLAFYGYAHVPWMSKRQVMIDANLLPSAPERHRLAADARTVLEDAGYLSIGIDHFALPSDSLAKLTEAGKLKRNFQGYTDDQAETLIGLGASAISRYREGYSQNAVPTAAYTERVLATGRAAHKGFALTERDKLLARMIEEIMCYGTVDVDKLSAEFPEMTEDIAERAAALLDRYPDLFSGTERKFSLPPHFMCMARIVAASLEEATIQENAHSIAI